MSYVHFRDIHIYICSGGWELFRCCFNTFQGRGGSVMADNCFPPQTLYTSPNVFLVLVVGVLVVVVLVDASLWWERNDTAAHSFLK